jgi:phosphate starvation-inducible PhoH-like protein
VENILDGVKDVEFIRLTSHDVVRHKLVGRIVAAYDKYDAEVEASASSGPRRSGA